MTKTNPLFTIAFFIATIILHSNSFGQTYGQNGMVVSDNTIASKIGTDILGIVALLTL